jgi:hypothetical protein
MDQANELLRRIEGQQDFFAVPSLTLPTKS